MKSSIVPLIENKTGDTNDKYNYRPVALATALSKIFEFCILKIIDSFYVQILTSLVSFFVNKFYR